MGKPKQDTVRIEDLNDFIDAAEIYLFVPGWFDITKTMFTHSLKRWIETGGIENPIEEWLEVTQLLDSHKRGETHSTIVSERNMFYLMDAVEGTGFWDWKGIVGEDGLTILSDLIRDQDSRRDARNTYKMRRRRANTYISKKEVRDRIFKRDGKKCKMCKTTRDLSIDHIKSVLEGGGNEDSNLQTLCRRCNASKGG